MRLISKFNAKCGVCGNSIKKGDLIEWSPDYEGAKHPQCLLESPLVRRLDRVIPGEVTPAIAFTSAESSAKVPQSPKTIIPQDKSVIPKDKSITPQKTITHQEEIENVKAELFATSDRMDYLIDRLAELQMP